MLSVRADEGLGSCPTESRRPAQPPRFDEELLTAFPGAGGWAAARVERETAPADHAAAPPSFRERRARPAREPRRQAASRGAGRTMERGAGPAGTPRPAGSGRRAAPSRGPNHRRPSARPARRGPQVSFRPGGRRTALASPPPASAPGPQARGARGGRRVNETLLYQPGSAPFLQGDSVPALSGAAVCLIYAPHAFSSRSPTSQQVRAKI